MKQPPSSGSHLRLVSASARGGQRASQALAPDEVEEPLPVPNVGDKRARNGARARTVREETHGPKSSRGRMVNGLQELTDARLVPIALTGDQLALEALYRKHVSFAIHLATRIEGSSRDVEDVVHDAFIRAFSRLSDLSDPAAFRSWLGSIVVYAVRSRLRRARLMSLLGLGRGADPIDLDSITSNDASPHTRAQLAQIYALLRTLPTDERIGWTLRYVEGHELDVVARLTNCSLATVKRRIGRAQKFLEQHFVDTLPVLSEGVSEDTTTTPSLLESDPPPSAKVGTRLGR